MHLPSILPEGTVITLSGVHLEEEVTSRSAHRPCADIPLRVSWKHSGLILWVGKKSMRCTPGNPEKIDFEGAGGAWAQWEACEPPMPAVESEYDPLPTGAVATVVLRNRGVSAAQAARALESDVDGAFDPLYLHPIEGGWEATRDPVPLVLRLVEAVVPLNKAMPAQAVKPCLGGCGFAVTWHSSHCCIKCQSQPGCGHGAKCHRRPMLSDPPLTVRHGCPNRPMRRPTVELIHCRCLTRS